MPVSWFLDRLRAHGDAPAIVWQDTTISYRALLTRVEALRQRLVAAGLVPGSVVAFAGDHSPTGCALLLALAAERAVMVPMSGRALEQPEERLAISEAQLVIRLGDGDELDLERRDVVPRNPLTRELIALGHPGLVIFTSGSTGQSKGALHDFTRTLERYRQPRRAWRVLSFLIFDHTGGINTVLHTLGNGGTLVTVADRSPDAVCAAVERHRVQLLPPTPTFLNMMLMDAAHERHDLSSLELITYGTEVMPQATLTRLRAALPGVRLQQLYGLTEIGVMRSLSPDPGSPWVRLGGEGFEVKVVAGTLHVRTRFGMLGYLNAPSPYDADGWLDTHDRVEVRGDEVKILGRDTDLINVGGQKVYPAEVEAVLLELPNVKDATVVAHKNPVMGHVVAAQLVLHAPEPLAEVRRRLRAFCEPRLARYKIPVMVELADDTAVGERYKKLRPQST